MQGSARMTQISQEHLLRGAARLTWANSCRNHRAHAPAAPAAVAPHQVSHRTKSLADALDRQWLVNNHLSSGLENRMHGCYWLGKRNPHCLTAGRNPE